MEKTKKSTTNKQSNPKPDQSKPVLTPDPERWVRRESVDEMVKAARVAVQKKAREDFEELIHLACFEKMHTEIKLPTFEQYADALKLVVSLKDAALKPLQSGDRSRQDMHCDILVDILRKTYRALVGDYGLYVSASRSSSANCNAHKMITAGKSQY